MPAPRIRGDYDALAQISQVFARQAEEMLLTIQRVQRQKDTLQSGDWVGKGATAFYQEMDGEVLPSLKRLATALSTANRVARQISQILNQAEEEAARILIAVGTSGFGVSIGAAMGAAAEQASWQKANLLLVQNPVGEELDQFIESLAGLRNRPVVEIQIEFERFQEISEQRDAINPDTPPSMSGGAQSSFGGSDTQMRFGSVVGDAFDIDPVFGSMLNPTGGLMGPGKWAIAGANTAVGYHSVVHDAAGYLHNYHQVGPGYDYLGLEGGDTSNPLSGQRTGIAFWHQASGGASSTSASAGFTARGAVGGTNLGSKLTENDAIMY